MKTIKYLKMKTNHVCYQVGTRICWHLKEYCSITVYLLVANIIEVTVISVVEFLQTCVVSEICNTMKTCHGH